MNFLEGFNQAFFPVLLQKLQEDNRRKQLEEAQGNLTNELNPYTNIPAPTAQVPAQAGNATHLSMPAMQIQGVPTTERQPVDYGSPQMIQALQHYMTSTGQGMDLNSLLAMQGLGQPKYTVSDKGLGGLDIIRQQGSQEPTVKEVRPPFIRPTNPTEASLAMDASNANSPTAQKSMDALKRIQEIRTAGATPNILQDTAGNYYVTQSPKAGGEPTTYDIGLKGNIKGVANGGKGAVKLVLDGETGRAKYKYMTDITDSDKPLSNQALTKGEMASTVSEHIPETKQLIEKLDNDKKLGAMASRWNAFLAGNYGAGDYEFNQLRADISLIKSGLANVHFGARGGGAQIQEMWNKILNAEKMDKQTLYGALDAYKNWLDKYGQMGGNPTTPSVKGKTSTITPEDQQAIDWAKANKSNPKAQQILQLHGIK